MLEHTQFENTFCQHVHHACVCPHVADACSFQGRHAEAEELQLDVLEASRRVRGAGHPDTLFAARNLAITHGHLGKHAEACGTHVEDRQRSTLQVPLPRLHSLLKGKKKGKHFSVGDSS